MDNGSRFPYRIRFEPGDGEGQPPAGEWYSGARKRGVEQRRKRCELSSETELLRRPSGGDPASKKSPKFVKSNLPVPETDTGG
jgi:hypothetical protein